MMDKMQKIEKTQIIIGNNEINSIRNYYSFRLFKKWRPFIEIIHVYFDELHYYETKSVERYALSCSFADTILHCKEYNDIIVAYAMYKYCIKHWRRIERIFKKHLNEFNAYKKSKKSIIKRVANKATAGLYCITNSIYDYEEQMILIGDIGEGDNIYTLIYENKVYKSTEDYNYYIKLSFLSRNKIFLYNKEDKKICDIVYDNEEIFLENNNTIYEIVYSQGDHFMGIALKDENVLEGELVDKNKIIAEISCMILDYKHNFELSSICIYDECDFELITLFAMSLLLLENKAIQLHKILQASLALTISTRWRL